MVCRSSLPSCATAVLSCATAVLGCATAVLSCAAAVLPLCSSSCTEECWSSVFCGSAVLECCSFPQQCWGGFSLFLIYASAVLCCAEVLLFVLQLPTVFLVCLCCSHTRLLLFLLQLSWNASPCAATMLDCFSLCCSCAGVLLLGLHLYCSCAGVLLFVLQLF
jgi:hypothetical protein